MYDRKMAYKCVTARPILTVTKAKKGKVGKLSLLYEPFITINMNRTLILGSLLRTEFGSKKNWDPICGEELDPNFFQNVSLPS